MGFGIFMMFTVFSKRQKNPVLWQLANIRSDCAYNYAIKLLKVVRTVYKADFE